MNSKSSKKLSLCSIIPSARNNRVSSTFLTVESFSVFLNETDSIYRFKFSATLRLFCVKKQFVHILKLGLGPDFLMVKKKMT